MNRIQFQPGLSLPQFMELYGTEEKCEAALEKARWPNGFQCPRCEGKEYGLVEPVFGQTKENRGLRRSLLRGLEKVNREWSLMSTGHNLLKLFRFSWAVT